MKRLMFLASIAVFASTTQAAETAPATVAGQLAALTAACDHLDQRAAGFDGRAKSAKLKAWTKAELARAPAIQVPPKSEADDSRATPLKSDLVRGWWLDSGRTASLIYQEADEAPGGSRWRSCVVSARVPDAAAALKSMLPVQTRLSPDAWTDTSGKLLVVNFDKGPTPGALPGAVMAQFDTSLPFPDMNFILVKKDPQYAAHTPHPIAVTEAEVFAATAMAGTVAYKRESPVVR